MVMIIFILIQFYDKDNYIYNIYDSFKVDKKFLIFNVKLFNNSGMIFNKL